MTRIMIAQQVITLQLKQPHHCVHACNLPSSFSELAQCGCLSKSLMLAELIQTSQGSGASVWTVTPGQFDVLLVLKLLPSSASKKSIFLLQTL